MHLHVFLIIDYDLKSFLIRYFDEKINYRYMKNENNQMVTILLIKEAQTRGIPKTTNNIILSPNS